MSDKKRVIELKNDIAQWQVDLIYARSPSVFTLTLKKISNATKELNLLALPKNSARKTKFTQSEELEILDALMFD